MEDALNLLTSYGYPPFPILEQNLSCIDDQLMPDVMYALNMGRSDGLLYALLDKCCRIFRELAGYARGQDASYYGEMPQSAIIQYCQNQTTEIAGYLKNSPCCTWRLDHLPDDSPRTGEEGGPLPVVVVGNDVRHRISPVSGMYYPEAGFWISFHLDKAEAYLIYQMGPRFGRCFTYDVCFHDGYRAELTNEQANLGFVGTGTYIRTKYRPRCFQRGPRSFTSMIRICCLRLIPPDYPPVLSGSIFPVLPIRIRPSGSVYPFLSIRYIPCHQVMEAS